MENETNLFVFERYTRISNYLKEKGRATVEELSEFLFVSPATIRRDLTAMQKLGMLKRTHGGAVLNSSSDDISIFVRMESESEEKELAAEVGLKHLPPFNSVFIDNSSTCLALAEKMDFSYKTVVTNGIQLASKLALRKYVDLILIGGKVTATTNATQGGIAIETLETFRFDLMLQGAASVTHDGAYERSLETMLLKKAAFNRSNKRVLVVGRSKFDLQYLYRTAMLEDYDAICTDADAPYVAEWREKGIKIYNK